ncbi:DUF3048 domain-containing protein [Streptomyces albipurpureus]|uniref:DUF3048 domain-containing protein n=1 Tax=Streptomyces albipurpureus TaxID=2897419 RepID=A0ABT0UR19_9ACTN|nr:DUF3048 domain-containing protein [Streptomyces sp. CWNU-1]MCM2389696.1 DUF3048 domain-containing protein [Streptomyces sp. CWNU-1]
MERSARTRFGALGAVLAVLLATLLGACSDGSEGSPEESPTTAAGPVLAVKIDNAPPARPQTGLNAADVVYAEQVEAGLSRLMALYATRLPNSVGPVRSARESDLELLAQFPNPTLVFSGAQSKLLPLIDAAPLRPVTPRDAPAGAFVRDRERSAPYNLYVRPPRVQDETAGAKALERAGFRTGQPPGGGEPVAERTVRFPSARFTFTWSAQQKRWGIAIDGSRAVEPDGTAVTAATVVIQRVEVKESQFQDFRGSNSPLTVTVGSGGAEMLRDGRAYPGEWKRTSVRGGTTFTTRDGDPLNIADGPVWVMLVAR